MASTPLRGEGNLMGTAGDALHEGLKRQELHPAKPAAENVNLDVRTPQYRHGAAG